MKKNALVTQDDIISKQQNVVKVMQIFQTTVMW